MKRTRFLFLPALAILILIVGLLGLVGEHQGQAHAAAAKKLTVANCGNDIQLQKVITKANGDNAGDTITFRCSGDIKLTKTLTITGSMTLDGSGQTVTLDGNNSMRVLHRERRGQLHAQHPHHCSRRPRQPIRHSEHQQQHLYQQRGRRRRRPLQLRRHSEHQQQHLYQQLGIRQRRRPPQQIRHSEHQQQYLYQQLGPRSRWRAPKRRQHNEHQQQHLCQQRGPAAPAAASSTRAQ